MTQIDLNKSETYTHTQLLDLWPLEKVLAADMGVTVWCMRKWKLRNFIPPWYWPKFIEILESTHGIHVSYKDMTFSTLHRLRRKK